MRNVSRNYKPSSPLHPLPRGFDRGQTRSARWTERIGSGGAYKRAALCIVDSLCPRGCSETEVGARVPPGRSRTRRLRPLSVAIGYRASEASYGVTAAAQAKALRMAFADSWGRRGLTRESLNLDAPPPIIPWGASSSTTTPPPPPPSPQAYVTYLHRHRRSILSRDFRARDYARRNLSLEFVSRIGEGGRRADPAHIYTRARSRRGK